MVLKASPPPPEQVDRYLFAIDRDLNIEHILECKLFFSFMLYSTPSSLTDYRYCDFHIHLILHYTKLFSFLLAVV